MIWWQDKWIPSVGSHCNPCYDRVLNVGRRRGVSTPPPPPLSVTAVLQAMSWPLDCIITRSTIIWFKIMWPCVTSKLCWNYIQVHVLRCTHNIYSCVSGDSAICDPFTTRSFLTPVWPPYIASQGRTWCVPFDGRIHYSDVIMGEMASKNTRLAIVYSSVSGTDKKTIKAPGHWPSCGEFTGDRWIPRTNGQ